MGIELLTLLKPHKLLILRARRSHKFPKLAQPEVHHGYTENKICMGKNRASGVHGVS